MSRVLSSPSTPSSTEKHPSDTTNNAVTVVVRVRPLSQAEIAKHGIPSILVSPDHKSLEILVFIVSFC